MSITQSSPRTHARDGLAWQLLLYVAVLVAASAWLAGFVVSIGGPGDDAPDWAGHVLAVGLISAPWLLAMRFLWRAWWARHGDDVAALDAPARLLALAVATLPADRHDWGAGMTAELAGVRDPRDRWRFAAGCARAALAPARGDRAPVVAVAAWVAAALVVAGPALGDVVPAMRVFAVTFAGLAGVLVVLTAARAPRVRAPAAGTAVTLAGLAGVVACIAAAGWFLTEMPAGARHLPPPTAVWFAVLLAGALWLTLSPPAVLVAGGPLPRVVGLVLALGLGGGLLVWSRLALRDVGGLDSGVFGYLYLLAPLALVAGGALAAAARRSFRAGVQAAAWTALLGSLAVFAVAVPESVAWYRHDTSLILAGDAVPLDAVGENLRNFVWQLVLVPFWWLPFGVLGAAAGRYATRWFGRGSAAGAGSTRVSSR